MYRYSLDDINYAIEQLVQWYPKCFFIDPEKRRPQKHTIITDLIKSGVQLQPDLLRAAIERYQSHFGYKYSLQAGVKRIDLNGNEDGTVSEQEQHVALKYIRERKQEERERRLEENERRNASLIVETKKTTPDFNSPITKLPMMNVNIKGMAMPKVVKSNDPLAQIQSLLDAVHNAAFEQPEPLRRPFAVAGLRVLVIEIEKTISTIESNTNQ